ncbi:MAG: urate oxidase [Streptosporangiaceae bacterium]|nr:urate oxidase [Streptosporangiaceae bacterium]
MIVLGANQYGKAEVRVVRVNRPDGGPHTLRDLSVSVALSGALEATHLTGDNAAVLTTDAQKNTVFAFAAEHGVGEIEDFGILLARHFVSSQAAISVARIRIEEYAWEPIAGTGHSFARSGGEVRTAAVTVDGTRTWVVSGLRDLVVLNSAGSEFWGFARDRYTTLTETTDRILATAVDARWRHSELMEWAAAYRAAREALLAAFGQTHSYSLQQTLFAMGKRVLEELPTVAEIRLSLPNKHHFEVDMSSFGVESEGTVFYAADRPYGLIEGSVLRDDAPPAPSDVAW